MAGMDAQPADSKTKGIPRSLLLYFPWLLIVVVAVVALSYWHWLSVPRTTVARFNACIESAAEAKQKAKGQLDMQDIRACEKLNDASVEDLVKAPIDELKWTLYRKANQGLRNALDKVRKELLELVATAAQAQR